jgi:predicted Zn-ribbon and HTH transcriptional regulator
LSTTARKKVAKALVSGSAIKIEGGSYVFLKNRLKCKACGFMWETKYETREKSNCPECKSENINYADRNFPPAGFKKRFRGGRG